MFTSRHARTTAIGFAALAALTFAGAGAAQAAPPDATTVPLNTGQEAPAPTEGGAHGMFTYEIDGDELCYTLEVTGLSSDAVAAHIRLAPRNVPGPVVVPLTVESDTSFVVSDCVTDADVPAIEADPTAYYVNVHTVDNMSGEVRGQLR
ncbi:MAG TPA: CHRD domain-containing protein [Agromyces sp.]|nr:CHRD domain-containing protein [Agromyces sp.]